MFLLLFADRTHHRSIATLCLDIHARKHCFILVHALHKFNLDEGDSLDKLKMLLLDLAYDNRTTCL